VIQDRKMYQGNWKCSKCGTDINELPFEPKEGLDILCKECHREKLGEKGGRNNFQRKMFQGNWKCASCGKEITELPFEPKEGQEILCRDCYRAQKGY